MTSNTRVEGAASAAPSLVIPEGASAAQLERMEQEAWDAIEDVQDPGEAEVLLSQVTVAAQAVRIMKVGADREQRWGGLRLRAERKWGELLGPAVDKGGGHRTVSASNSERFAHNQARKVAGVPQADFDAYLTESEKPTRTGLLRATTAGRTTRQPKRSKEISPPEAYDRLRERSKEVRLLPSDQRPRWTETDADLVDTVLKHLLKRRPKYSGRRLRELAAKRRNGRTQLADFQYRMMQLTSILESVDVAAFELADADEVSEFHDDLVELQQWMDRSIEVASSRLSDADLERKIRKLRGDSTGRTDFERRTAEALADKLERRRRESRIAN